MAAPLHLLVAAATLDAAARFARELQQRLQDLAVADVRVEPFKPAEPAARTSLTLLLDDGSAAVDAQRAQLLAASQPFSIVHTGDATSPALPLDAALDAVTPLLAGKAPGLFSRLLARSAAETHRRWVCNDCDVPECEHALQRR